MSLNGKITQSTFTDFPSTTDLVVKTTHITELRNAVNKLNTYIANVDNCGYTNCCQSCQNACACQGCQTCQGCQNTCACQSCQNTCTCQSCQKHYNCNCNDCGGTCFIKGTLVLMADNTWKPMETIRVGEYVRGMTGINRVEGLDRTFLGNKRSVYTFEDKTLYFSGEHNMWVKKGNDEFFGVIDVAQHLREKNAELFPELVGYTLNRDVIIIDRPVDFATLYGWKREDPIIAREYGDTTPLYCLILDGDHTMFVNGYLAGGFPHDDDFDYSQIHWTGLKGVK